jgi:DNA-binding MarR family transcriptional regulator
LVEQTNVKYGSGMTTDEPMRGVTPREDLIDVLVQATFVTMAVLNGVAADNDLSLTQLRVLAILRDRKVRMSALAVHLGLDKSTMSGLVDRAVKRGLLTRSPSSDDGRAIEVSLSRAGADLAEELYTRITALLSPTTDRLSPAERNRLQMLLQRLLGTADSEGPKDVPPL